MLIFYCQLFQSQFPLGLISKFGRKYISGIFSNTCRVESDANMNSLWLRVNFGDFHLGLNLLSVTGSVKTPQYLVRLDSNLFRLAESAKINDSYPMEIR